jgi:AGZA family xanthine/uracil permease-like MFS transporter
MKSAISVGIGLFITSLGMKNCGLVVPDESTIIALGDFSSAPTQLCVIGLILISILLVYKVKGGLLIGILVTALIGIPMGVTQIPENFSLVSLPSSIEPIALKLDFTKFVAFDINYLVIVFTLLLMDLFDTLGTLIGAAAGAGMMTKKGEIVGINRALMADAVGTTIGSLCGTSTVTTYVESTAGIAEGGRTGMTAFSVAILFLIALFFSPVFLIIPSAATTSALVLVGVMMIKPIVNIEMNDFTEAVPCFIAMLMMPFTASIAEGIVLGMLSYVFIKVCTGRGRQVSIMMYVLAVFFIFKYIAPLINA